jgi:hypothetical protein
LSKRSIKTWLIVVALALLAGLVVFMLRSRADEPVGASVTDMSRGPSFDVHVEKPRLARPLFGIIPNKLEEKLFGGGELRFDDASHGAKVGNVGNKHLELSADGWDLLIETNDKGQFGPGTHLVFPMELAERQRTLRCRPANGAPGYLHTSAKAGSGEIDGDFLVEFDTCENAETGKVIEWPPAPLTVRGRFGGLPPGRNDPATP